jgi:hypothetical protein
MTASVYLGRDFIGDRSCVAAVLSPISAMAGNVCWLGNCDSVRSDGSGHTCR